MNSFRNTEVLMLVELRLPVINFTKKKAIDLFLVFSDQCFQLTRD